MNTFIPKALGTLLLAVTNADGSIALPAGTSALLLFNTSTTNAVWVEMNAAAVIPAVGVPGSLRIAPGAYIVIGVGATPTQVNSLHAIASVAGPTNLEICCGSGE